MSSRKEHFFEEHGAHVLEVLERFSSSMGYRSRATPGEPDSFSKNSKQAEPSGMEPEPADKTEVEPTDEDIKKPGNGTTPQSTEAEQLQPTAETKPETIGETKLEPIKEPETNP